MSEAFESVDNPYAPPKADILNPISRLDESCWRRGNIVVMAQGSDLPCRCVKCNEPAQQPIKPRGIFWHPPGWFILLLGGIVLYALALVFVQRKAAISPGLCAGHARRRSKLIGIAWLTFFGSIPCFIFSAEVTALAFVGLAAVLASIIIGAVAAVRISPVRIDKELVELKGFGAPFLDSLPTQPGLQVW
jgi:hypothetical protein